MLIYRYFNGFNYTETETIYAKVSFGNMGYSTNTCGMNFIDWEDVDPITGFSSTNLNLQCEGTARIRRIIDAGIVDTNQGGDDA